MSSKNELGLSFLDVLSCTLGGLIVLFTVFSAMQRDDGDQGAPAVSVTPAPDNSRRSDGSSNAPQMYRIAFNGRRPVIQRNQEVSTSDGVKALFSDARPVAEQHVDSIQWHVLLVVPSELTSQDVSLDLGVECSANSHLKVLGVWGPEGLPRLGAWSRSSANEHRGSTYELVAHSGDWLKSITFTATVQPGIR